MNTYQAPEESPSTVEPSVVDRTPIVRRLRRWLVLFNALLLIELAMFVFILLWTRMAPFDRSVMQKVEPFIVAPLWIVHLSAMATEFRILLLFPHGPLRKSTDDSAWRLIVEHLLALIPRQSHLNPRAVFQGG